MYHSAYTQSAVQHAVPRGALLHWIVSSRDVATWSFCSLTRSRAQKNMGTIRASNLPMANPPRSRPRPPSAPPPPRIPPTRVDPRADGGNPFASQAGSTFEQPAAPAQSASFGGGGMPTSSASAQGAMLEFTANQWRQATGKPYWWIVFSVLDVACSCALIADGFLCVRAFVRRGAFVQQSARARGRAFVGKSGD